MKRSTPEASFQTALIHLEQCSGRFNMHLGIGMRSEKSVPIPDVPDTPQTGGTLPVIPLAAGFFGVAAAALMVWKKRGVVKK